MALSRKRDEVPSVRVRFAPSPTGDLHVGGVRTALFNYVYARHCGGKFLLRIEDTDRNRSTAEATRVILEGLNWLGIEADEEIVYQGARLERHQQAAQQLVESGAAYYAFETPEELERMREGGEYKYNRAALNLTPQQMQTRLKRGDPCVIRLRIPEGEVAFVDGVHGEIRTSCDEMDDLILLRSDGTPTYNLAVVVDDADMGITLVLRGDDHISNTPKQILIYQALGLPVPQFAHVPLILGADRRKLSKRHQVTSILGYRERGYLPQTMISYLGLLGWSPGDDRNEITVQELIARFDISGIQSSNAVFDEAKLNWLNGIFIGRTDYPSVAAALHREARRAVENGVLPQMPASEQMENGWNLLRTRIHLVGELFSVGRYMFVDPDSYEPKGIKKSFHQPGIDEKLLILAEDFGNLNRFEVPAIEEVIRKRGELWELNAGKLIHPLRLAVSGVTYGAGLFEMMAALGRETIERRIRKAVEFIRG